jgi:hypothetical protein
MIRFHKELPRCRQDFLPYVCFCGSKHFWNLFIGVIFGYINVFCSAKDWMVKGYENGLIVYSRNPKYKDEELIMWPNPKKRKGTV